MCIYVDVKLDGVMIKKYREVMVFFMVLFIIIIISSSTSSNNSWKKRKRKKKEGVRWFEDVCEFTNCS